MSCSHRLAARGGRIPIRHILEILFGQEVEHEEFDQLIHGLFQGERGEENYLRIQNSRLTSLRQREEGKSVSS
jgi:hypothetical protein